MEQHSINQKKIESLFDEQKIIDQAFYKEIRQQIICQKCQKILFNPKMCSSCKNHYCAECSNNILSTNEKCVSNSQQKHQIKIQQCKKYLPVEAETTKQDLLNKLSFSCKYKEQGCHVNSIYQDCISHNLNCPFKPIACSGCNQTILKNLMPQHQKKCKNLQNNNKQKVEIRKDFEYQVQQNNNLQQNINVVLFVILGLIIGQNIYLFNENQTIKKEVEKNWYLEEQFDQKILNLKTDFKNQLEQLYVTFEEKLIQQKEEIDFLKDRTKNFENKFESYGPSLIKIKEDVDFQERHKLAGKVIQNFSFLDIGFGKWRKIFEQQFSNTNFTSKKLWDLQKKIQNNSLLLVGVKRLDQPKRILMGAFDYSSEVFQQTQSLTEARQSISGLYWYFVQNISFGFSDTQQINLQNNIDTTPGEKRLSWQIGQNSNMQYQRSRVGDLQINNISNYKRVIWIME